MLDEIKRATRIYKNNASSNCPTSALQKELVQKFFTTYVGTTLAASCTIMPVVATPTNAVVFGCG